MILTLSLNKIRFPISIPFALGTTIPKELGWEDQHHLRMWPTTILPLECSSNTYQKALFGMKQPFLFLKMMHKMEPIT
jgi:hypothetical protein